MKKLRNYLLVLLLCLTSVFAFGVNAEAAARLNKKSISLAVGQTFKLKVKGTKKKIKWSSSNKKIASVSKKGVVKAKKKGKCVITAKVGSKKYKCKVTVKAASVLKAASKKVTLTGKKRTADILITYKSDTYDTPNVLLDHEDVISCEWGKKKNADQKYLTVKALKDGTARIDLKADDSPKVVTIRVTVKNSKILNLPISKVNLTAKNPKVTTEVTYTGYSNLIATAADSDIVDFVWGKTWDDEKISLTFVPILPGKTTVTIKEKSGKLSMTIPVTVTDVEVGNYYEFLKNAMIDSKMVDASGNPCWTGTRKEEDGSTIECAVTWLGENNRMEFSLKRTLDGSRIVLEMAVTKADAYKKGRIRVKGKGTSKDPQGAYMAAAPVVFRTYNGSNAKYWIEINRASGGGTLPVDLIKGNCESSFNLGLDIWNDIVKAGAEITMKDLGWTNYTF